MLQVAVEVEISLFLGRDYYERRPVSRGSRSGYKPRTIKIGCGDIKLNMPKKLLPNSDIQRCTKHRTENILDKVLKQDREKAKDSLRKIFYAPTYEHAKKALEMFKRD